MPQQQTDVRHLASAAVVVGVDGSEASDKALDWAAGLAARRGRELRIVHGLDLEGMRQVYGRYDVWVPPVEDRLRAQGAALVARCAQRVREARPQLRVETEMSPEAPSVLLKRHSATAYLTVLGARGTSGFLGHVGSILLSVTSHASGPVVVVRADPEAVDTVRDRGPVVVGVDGSAVSEAALGAAFEEAAERDTDLVAVHVWNDFSFGMFAGDPYLLFPVPDIEVAEQAVLAERLAGWQAKYPQVPVTRKVYPSGPASVLDTLSADAQLVVVGSRGRGGFTGLLLGSTSNSLVQHAHCPVMVVHPEKG
ncbi:universal stress protein [Nocardia pseudobrasiliensis]|uniref:Nucleotide-binding universal stress UspA family protein n=1 Tax=Nocardia pseudobrasiliensis TaxID=45979 RepID=A0A370IC24_9NOCA|nr:universal stress protein [Nocardia pseudobrasiliensis]RDI68257.1 nucleotide-binding universal stress UspA family protein [Nocardia pseudobrasiliensis]